MRRSFVRLPLVMTIVLSCYSDAAEQRAWKDTTGSFSASAELLDVAGGRAYLRKDTGTTVAVPVGRLCNDDQTYILKKFPTPKVITGKVIGVADGDTLTVIDDDHNSKMIRLEGIDSPEGGQDFGDRAKRVLSVAVFGRTVQVEWREKDKYGRTLGHVFADGRWINKEIVEQGCAWHYKEYSKSPVLAAAESKAREDRVGLWGMPNQVPPWEFRHPEPTGQAHGASNSPKSLASSRPSPSQNSPASPTSDPIVFVTKTGAKYHAEGCRFLSKSKIPMPLSEAAARYSPCSACNPPKR